MFSQSQKALTFHKQHITGSPVILYNIWDAGSAKALQTLKPKAIATSSWSVAESEGFDDGEQLPFDLAIENLKRIVSVTELPVSFDIEAGYGSDSDIVYESVKKVVAAGAVGINIEDQIIRQNKLYTITKQCDRIAAARKAAEKFSIPLFINARTDICFQSNEAEHDGYLIEKAIERATEYKKAGADGLFVPGLKRHDLIAKLCQSIDLPLNIMIDDNHDDINSLAEIGVSRISFGPNPYIKLLENMKKHAKKYFN